MNPVLKARSIHHIGLVTTNFEESIAFYERLGFKNALAWGENERRICLMDLGNGEYIELFASGTGTEQISPRWVHLAFAVEDVNAAYEAALTAGAKPKNPPRVVPVDSTPAPATINCAFVYGPSGEELEFFRLLDA